MTIKFDGGIFNKPDPFRNQSPPPTQAEFSAAINELRAAKEKGLETMKFALDRLVALTGASATTSFLDGSSGNARFPYAGNLQTLAKKIDFARVDSVDEASRTIQITMDRELSAMPAAAGNVSVQIAAGVYDGTAIAPPAFGVSDDRRSDAFFKWGDALRDVTGLLEALAGSKHNSFKESNYKADIRVPYAGNVQELAKRIDFARVDSVDEGTRTIRITLDRELAAKPR